MIDGCLRLPSECKLAASFKNLFDERLGEHVGRVEFAWDVLDANLAVRTLEMRSKPVVSNSNVLGAGRQARGVCCCKGNACLIVFEDGSDAAFTGEGKGHFVTDVEV
jgi:hypothetical protein